MIFRAYLPKFLTALFGGIFVALGIWTFGKPWAFDGIYIGLLIFTGIVCRKDINVVTLIIILVLQLIWESLAWKLLVNEDLTKLFFYPLALYLACLFRYDWLSKIVATTILITSASELYWYITDYDAPEIYWYIWIMVSNLLIRYLIFCRVSLVDNYFPAKGESINLDWIIYKLNAGLTILQAAMVFEYLLRHLFNFEELIVLYHSYSYIIHTVGSITIWAIFTESSKRLIPKLLKA